MKYKQLLANATRVTVLPALALFFSTNTLAQQRESGALSAHWEAYIISSLRSSAGVSDEPRIQDRRTLLSHALAESMRNEIRLTLNLSDADAFNVHTLSKAGFAANNSSAFSGLGLLAAGPGVAAQQQFAPSISHVMNSGASVSVGGLFVYESFTARGLGANAFGVRGTELSSGSALTARWDSAPMGRFSYGAQTQSRVKMDSYQNYLGVFTTPGRFDLPGRVAGNLSWTDRFGKFTATVERVNYAAVEPFTSASLPDEFLSLLGDSASPRFAWNDLNIYSLSYEAMPSEFDRLTFTWASSQQPSPSSALLRSVLDLESNRNFALSYSRILGHNARLRFAANYAPTSYFFGPAVIQADSFANPSKLEAEARFEVSF